MKKLFFLVIPVSIILVFFCFARTSQAATHYVSPTGGTNWAASTDISAPCSLATAFANAAAGDTVYLRGASTVVNYTGSSLTTGAHNGTNNTKNGGAIWFENYAGETVNFTGATDWLLSRSYWVFKGFNFIQMTENPSQRSNVEITGSYNELRNCLFDANHNALYGGMLAIYTGGHNTVDGCTFQHNASASYPDGNVDALAIGYGGPASSYNIISNCTFIDNNSYNIVNYGGSYNQYINNYFDNSANTGLGISLYGYTGTSDHNLIDGNTFVGFGSHNPNPGNCKSMIQLWSNYNTFRRNIFRDSGTGTCSDAFETDVISHPAHDNLIYNNVFYNLYYQAVNIGQANVTNNKFYNNVFWKNHTAPFDQDGVMQGASFVIFSHSSLWNNIFSHNFILYTTDNAHIIYQDGDRSFNNTGAAAAYPTLWTNNLSINTGPGFVDPVTTHDFHLAAGSPSIDTGVVVNDPDWGNLTYSGSAPDLGVFESAGGGTDTQAPTVPTNLSASAVSSSQINLTWTASTDNVGVTGYRIYRCAGSGCTPSTQISTSATNSYSDSGLTASTVYVYTVAAYDATGNISGQSTSALATTQAPPVTNNNPIGSFDTADSSYVVGWAYDQEAGSNPINVDIYIDGTNRARVSANLSRPDLVTAGVTPDANHGYNFSLTGLNLSVGNHTVNVYAINTPTGNNPLLPGSPKTINIPVLADTQVPTTPTNLNATAVSQTQINLSWTASTDNVGVTGYKIYRAGTQIGAATTNTYSNTGLTAGTSYSYTVSAYDAAGNNSGQSTSASATTQAATVVNHDPIGSLDVADNTHVSGWAYDQEAGSNPINVDIYLDGVNQARISASLTRNDLVSLVGSANHGFNYSFTNLSTGIHTVRVYAINTPTGNNPELPGSPKTINSPDTQAPTAPINLTAFTISPNQINLSWTVSTDNVKVTGYRIYRCTGAGCPPSTQVNTSTINSYSDTGLSANTIYIYRLAAYDAAENVSSLSNSAPSTTSVTSTINQMPVGRVDEVSNRYIRGWAYDPNASSSPIRVNIYINRNKIADILADLPRADLYNTVKSINHGFKYFIGGLADGNYKIKVYAINTPAGTNPQLLGFSNVMHLGNDSSKQ